MKTAQTYNAKGGDNEAEGDDSTLVVAVSKWHMSEKYQAYLESLQVDQSTTTSVLLNPCSYCPVL
eukprot:3800341-Rhodomonas_salina.2